jgi:8-oxo-dGTP diphosphatase
MPDDYCIRVAAAVIEENGRILIAKRKEGEFQGGKWEFPGGKIEDGETPEECLKRELREELGIDTRIGEFIGASRHAFTCQTSIELLAYRAFHLSGTPQPLDHEEIRWVPLAELNNYEFPPADKPILAKLAYHQFGA